MVVALAGAAGGQARHGMTMEDLLAHTTSSLYLQAACEKPVTRYSWRQSVDQNDDPVRAHIQGTASL